MYCGKCSKQFGEGSVCPFCGHDCSGDMLQVVKNEEPQKKGKKMSLGIIIAIVAAAVVIITVIICVAVSKKPKDGNVEKASDVSDEITKTEDETDIDEEPSIPKERVSAYTFSGETTIEFDPDTGMFSDEEMMTTAVHEEPGAYAQPSTGAQVRTETTAKSDYTPKTTEVTTVPSNVSDGDIKLITAFFSKKFYMSAHLVSTDGTNDLELAMDGEDIEALSDFDGHKVSFMRQGGKTYIKNTESKTYMSLSSAVLKLMGVSADELEFDIGQTEYDVSNPSSVTKAAYDGKDATCYEYRTDDSDNVCKVIIQGGELKEIGTYKKDDTYVSSLQCDSFKTDIPSDMLTLNGYEKVNMISFMSSLS